jgi:hypothetical protein
LAGANHGTNSRLDRGTTAGTKRGEPTTGRFTALGHAAKVHERRRLVSIEVGSRSTAHARTLVGPPIRPTDPLECVLVDESWPPVRNGELVFLP